MVVSASQKIINFLVDLFQKDPELQRIQWFRVPRQAESMMEPSWGHIFASSKDHNQHGYQDLYAYTQFISIIIGYPQQEPDDAERVIHTFEEIIEDLIIKNRQPDIEGLQMREGVEIENSEYVGPAEVGWAIDTLLMDLKFEYNRVVPQ